jgi:hypothetical protein
MTDREDVVSEVLRLIGEIPDPLDPSWLPIDLRPVLDGTVERVTPTVLRRDDEVGLFYAGRVNGLHGDSGAGKSMVLAVAAAQELNAGQHVGWTDLEDPDATTIVERLRMFGVSDAALLERLHYYAPREPFTPDAVERLVERARESALSLFVVDSVGEAFGLEGIDENKDVEVGPWFRHVARVLADAGPAVVLVDHSTKAADNPLHPSGSKRKRAAITGASYLLDASRPLTRDNGGRIRLTCAKDRHGTYKRGELAATIDLAVDPDGGVSVAVWAPIEGGDKPETRLLSIARAAVRAVKDAGEPLTQRRLLARMNVKASATMLRAGIEEAVARGALRAEAGPNRATLHAYVRDLEPGAPNLCV